VAAPDYAGAEKAILQRLENGLPKTLLYHNLDHIRDVVNAAERIGATEQLSADEMQLLRIAAWLHDAGLTISLSDHEQRGCLLARQLLPNFGFSEAQVESVCGMILATKIPQSPKTPSERVLCDADLDYLGRDDFFPIGSRLFDELVLLGKLQNEEQWNQMQKKFLELHQYHTAWSREQREGKKQQHLREIEALLRN
jgi:predicted metal-dependent HD superfamily phosphohydrolase